MFEPGREVDAVAVDGTVGLLDHVAEMDADAIPHPPLLGHRARGRLERLLSASAADTAPVAESNSASTESPTMSMTRPRLDSTCVRNVRRAASSAATVPFSSSAIRREKPTTSAARIAASRCLGSTRSPRHLASFGDRLRTQCVYGKQSCAPDITRSNLRIHQRARYAQRFPSTRRIDEVPRRLMCCRRRQRRGTSGSFPVRGARTIGPPAAARPAPGCGRRSRPA